MKQLFAALLLALFLLSGSAYAANSSTLITSAPARTDNYILVSDVDTELVVDSSAAFTAVFHVVVAKNFTHGVGPVHEIAVSHDGSSGDLEIINDEAGGTLSIPAGYRVYLVGWLFSDTTTPTVTFKSGATTIVAIDLAANQGGMLAVEGARK